MRLATSNNPQFRRCGAHGGEYNRSERLVSVRSAEFFSYSTAGGLDISSPAANLSMPTHVSPVRVLSIEITTKTVPHAAETCFRVFGPLLSWIAVEEKYRHRLATLNL